MMVAFQGLFVVTVVGHSLEDLGDGCIIAKQVIYHISTIIGVKNYHFRLNKMRSDEHKQEVLQAMTVRQVPGRGYEARAGGHQHHEG